MGSEARGMFLASAGLDGTMIHDSKCEELVEQVLKVWRCSTDVIDCWSTST